jgi:hypothetical protein
VADRSIQLILSGLRRAATEPEGLPLFTTRALPGLFVSTAQGKQAAQRCKDEGYLRVLRTEWQGKSLLEVCSITEKGLDYLVREVDPRPLLEDLVRAFEAREAQAEQLLQSARQLHGTFDTLKELAHTVLARLAPPLDAEWREAILDHLCQHATRHPAEDCPLPELYQQARRASPDLTIGQFHDGLRALARAEQVSLQPWTGPLYALPEPALALLCGHEIMYYANMRT